MTRSMSVSTKRPRLSIDLAPERRRRLRLAAAKRDLTVRQYVLETLEERLRKDLGTDAEGLLELTAKADPVLAALWGNPKDPAYDRASVVPRGRPARTRRPSASSRGRKASGW